MTFEDFNDYLLSINISQISREFGFKKIGGNSLYLLTDILRKHIEKIADDVKKSTESTGRMEPNLVDLNFNLIKSNNSQEDLLNYIKHSNIKYDFTKKFILKKIVKSEENQRKEYIKKINSDITTDCKDSIPKNILDSIPKHLKYFPKGFSLNEKDDDISGLAAEIPKEDNEDKIEGKEKFIAKQSFDETNIINPLVDGHSNNINNQINQGENQNEISFKDINQILMEETQSDSIFLGKKCKRDKKKK